MSRDWKFNMDPLPTPIFSTALLLVVGTCLCSNHVLCPKNHGISSHWWGLEIPGPCYTHPNPCIGGSNDS